MLNHLNRAQWDEEGLRRDCGARPTEVKVLVDYELRPDDAEAIETEDEDADVIYKCGLTIEVI